MRKSIQVLAILIVGLAILHFNKPITKTANSNLPIELQVMVNKLLTVSDYRGANISFILEGGEDNFRAESFPWYNTIYIGQGWLTLSKLAFGDYRLLYFILAHEISHIKNQDMYGNSLKVNRNQERLADRNAVYMLYKADMDCSLGELTANVLQIQKGFYVSLPINHPLPSERIDYMHKQCQSLLKTGKLPNYTYLEPENELDYSSIVKTYDRVILNIKRWGGF